MEVGHPAQRVWAIRPARYGSTGPSHDRIRRELDVLVLRWSVVVQGLYLGEQKLGSPNTQRMPRLPDGGQGHGGGGRKVNVVVADQRDLLGHRNSMSDESL
jgi:hypothetical protein